VIRTAPSLVTAMLAFLTAAAAAQGAPLAHPQARVVVTTDRRDYGPTDVVRFRVTLINASNSPIYVAKTWWYAGGGISGFNIGVKQLTGRRPKVGCGTAGDRAPIKDSRTPEQILREDFVRLGRGELIGFEDVYRGCAIKYPGTYQLTAEYSANDFNIQTVEAVSDGKTSVLQGRIQSKAFTFRVRPGKRKTLSN